MAALAADLGVIRTRSAEERSVTAAVLLVFAMASSSSDMVVVRLERLTNCGGWKVVIHESGESRGELFNSCHAGGPKRVTVQRSLTRGQVAKLVAKVEREDFTRLSERPEEAHPIEDDAACVIEVSLKRKHRVTVSGQQLSGQEAGLQAFRHVWHAVEELVPEPEW
jgi:hypothetical protein